MMMARRDFDGDAPEGEQLALVPSPDACGTPDLFGEVGSVDDVATG